MIRLATLSDKPAWNDYVNHHAKATFFHRFEWKEVIDEAIKHPTYYCLYEDNGCIKGILPLTHVKSMLFGNNMVSNPFCVYGGILADSNEIEIALYEYAQKLTQDKGAKTLELRNTEPLSIDVPTKDLYCTFKKSISQDHEENLKAIPRKQRAVVRKAIKQELKSEIDTTLDRFLLAYETSVRNLGTPVFSRRYFQTLVDKFSEDCDILTITKDGELLTSVLSFYFRGEVLPYYGGGLALARKHGANDFMYWRLMEHAVDNKQCHTFDFGRSKVGTGSYNFKRYWGFEPQPLYYQYFLNGAESIPEVNPMNPKYQFFIKAWKKLPLPMTRLIGPVLSRNLG